MNLRNLLLIASFFAVAHAQAQISYGGTPVAFDAPDRMAPVSFVEVTPDNLYALRAEDEIRDQHKDIPYRFGANIPVSLSMEDGEWQDLEKGYRVWRLAITSPGAVSLNFNFSTFNVPEGAQLFVYDADHTHFIGSFTHKNMQPHGGLGVSLIQSDRIIIEYIEPPASAGQGVLEIDNITHGYRSVIHKFENAERGPFGNSGSCNINVACDEGIGWEDQIRSVAIIVVGSNGICTGSMVNNTAEDGTPYFLTANHCLGGGVANWVFYFNHQAPNCGGSTGPTNQSVSGAVIRASNAGSDFALLELNETPPEAYDVFYNGWDNSGITPSSQTCIHHPGGDIKKITHDHDPATESVDGGAETWFINEWEEGTTEPGSSGSPLFDQDGRVIGQLYGGVASCTNDSYDYYGRFDVSWDGPSASDRLRDWLDPVGSGIEVLDGLGAAPLLPNDASAIGISGIDDVLCNESTASPVFNLRNSGTEDLTSAVIEMVLNSEDVGTVDWSGNLETGETELVQLPEIDLQDGENVLSVSVLQPNGEADDNPANNTATFEFNTFLETVEYEVEIVMDDYGSENTWVITDDEDNIVYAGGPYSEPSQWGGPEGSAGQVESEVLCIGEGCYTFTMQDDYGDGMCCEYGEGSYTLYDQFGDVVVTGGEFEDSESFDFCVTTVSIDEQKDPIGFNIFPNPAEHYITLELVDEPADSYQMQITDITGRIVLQEDGINVLNNRTINVADWSPGIYMLRIRDGNKQEVKRFVISR